MHKCKHVWHAVCGACGVWGLWDVVFVVCEAEVMYPC